MSGSGTPEDTVLFISLCLIFGCLVRRLRKSVPIPSSAVVFLFGIGLGLLETTGSSGKIGDASESVHSIDPHLFLQIFLPLLIFESS